MLNYFYKLISLGLQKKYSGPAGPVQELEISIDKENKIDIMKITHDKKKIIVDFVADLVETKIIHSEIENPDIIKTFLKHVNGTLFINDNEYEDLILEFLT